MTERRQDDLVAVERELVALSRRLRYGARDIYEANGLTFTEYSLLRMIDDTPGVTAAELATAAMIDKSTASRQLGGLRERGLLERVADGRTSRGQRLEPTDLGRKTLAAIASESAAAIASLLDDWPSTDIATFARLLARYNRAPTHAPTPSID